MRAKLQFERFICSAHRTAELTIRPDRIHAQHLGIGTYRARPRDETSPVPQAISSTRLPGSRDAQAIIKA